MILHMQLSRYELNDVSVIANAVPMAFLFLLLLNNIIICVIKLGNELNRIRLMSYLYMYDL